MRTILRLILGCAGVGAVFACSESSDRYEPIAPNLNDVTDDCPPCEELSEEEDLLLSEWINNIRSDCQGMGDYIANLREHGKIMKFAWPLPWPNNMAVAIWHQPTGTIGISDSTLAYPSGWKTGRDRIDRILRHEGFHSFMDSDPTEPHDDDAYDAEDSCTYPLS